MSVSKIIVLCAGQGSRLRPLTDNIPKCMVSLNGMPLLAHQLNAISATGEKDVILVGGYRSDALEEFGLPIIVNELFMKTNMVYSLWCAKEYFTDGFVMAYGDIVYSPSVLKSLLSSEADISVVVDKDWENYWKKRTDNILSDVESLSIDINGKISSIGQNVDNLDKIEGQYIGLVKFSKNGVKNLVYAIEKEIEFNSHSQSYLCNDKQMSNMYMTDLLQGLITSGIQVDPVWINGSWLEVDTCSDLAVAEERFRTKMV